MKILNLILVALLLSASLFASVPQKMSYQAIIRNNTDELVINKNVGIKISILQGSISGTAVYVEQQIATTNNNGLISIEIGGGTAVSGNFTNINWGNGSYFVKTEVDTKGGTDYTIIGTSQLLSAPYALHSKTADSISYNPSNPINITNNLSLGQMKTVYTTFSGDSRQPGLATMTKIAQNESKMLSKIYFYSATAGKQRFGIGTLDQRSWGIIEREFELDVVKGLNELNVLKFGYEIPANQQLFAYYHYTDKTETLTWGSYKSTDDNSSQMVYGSTSGVLGTVATTYGGYLNFKYELVSIDSPFATKDELKSVQATAETAITIASQVANNMGVVSDRKGNKYKLLVVNGALSLIPLQYKKVLVISNSYGLHNKVYSYGWCGDRGMASSIIDNDFVHLLQTGLKQKNAVAITTIANVAQWERDFTFSKSSLLDSYLLSDVDCIVFRAGENVSDASNFSTAIVDLMNYCFSKVPNADAYICSMLFPNTSKDNALLSAANSLNLKYVNCGVSNPKGYTSRIGDYCYGDSTSNGGTTWFPNTQVLYPISYAGVAAHPGDYGMLKMANSILDAMQYPILNIAHDITVIDNSSVGYICFDKWVKGGVFNIQTAATQVTAIDANSKAITVTKRNNGVFTFIMPDANVSITLTK